MDAGQLTNIGSLVYEKHRVASTVGKFTIEDAQALKTVYSGLGVHQTVHVPHPEFVRHLDVAGRSTAPAREAMLQEVNETEFIDVYLAKLGPMWDQMTGVAPCQRFIPASLIQLFEEGGRSYPPVRQLGATEVGDAIQPAGFGFVGQATVRPPEVYFQQLYAAQCLINRFIPAWKQAERALPIPDMIQVQGSALIPAAPDRYNVCETGIVEAVRNRLVQLVDGETLSERMTSQYTDLIFSLARLDYYGQHYYDVIEAIGQREHNTVRVSTPIEYSTRSAYLYSMKLFLEAIVDASRVLDVPLTFLTGANNTINTRQFEIMQHAFAGAKLVNGWFAPYFRWMPQPNRIHVSSSMGRWTLSARLAYERVEYEFIPDMVRLGNFEADAWMPTGGVNPGRDAASTICRTTASPMDHIVTIDLPIFPIDGEYGAARAAYSDNLVTITDRLSARRYAHGGNVPTIRPPGVPASVAREYLPLNGMTMSMAGLIQGYDLRPGFSINVLQEEGLGVSTNGVLAVPWGAVPNNQRPLQNILSYSLQPTPWESTLPWVVA